MGAIDEISGQGRSARLNTVPDATAADRGRAFRVICRNTTTQAEEDELLWMTGLHYKPEPETT